MPPGLRIIFTTFSTISFFQGKKFTCSCPRCIDPTEMGTFGSALICQSCRKKKKGHKTKDSDTSGLLLLKTVAESAGTKACDNNVFECNTCRAKKDYKDVEEFCLNIFNESEYLINAVPDRSSISKFEAFIKKYGGTFLHSDHMILTNLKYSLSGFYGRLPGYEMHEIDVAALTRKRQICDEALKVLNRIDLGISPRRGKFK